MGKTSETVAPSAGELVENDGADSNGRQQHKPLTDTAVKNAAPLPDRVRRLFDQRGLYLEISPSGGKWWRWKYRYMGKEKRLSLGVYPEVSLKAARERCDDARRLLRDGVDPGQDRKVAKLKRAQAVEDTFESVGRAWYQKESSSWTSKDHAGRVLRLLERDVYSHLGSRPIADIEGPEVLAMLQRMEARGVRDTTRRARMYCEKIFAHGFALGKVKHNPAAGLVDALQAPTTEHFPAITSPKEFGELLRKIDAYRGTFVVNCAMRLAPMLAVRPGELRKAQWKDIDLGNAQWSYVASKTHPDHIVPFSRQALKIVQELHRVTGTGKYVFPSFRSAARPMSDNAVLAALRNMGVPADEMSGHGFRASFRTIGDEVLGIRVDLLEHQLAHKVKDANGTAYNRTKFLPQRRKMMQEWSDYLDKLKSNSGS